MMNTIAINLSGSCRIIFLMQIEFHFYDDIRFNIKIKPNDKQIINTGIRHSIIATKVTE